MGNKSSKNRFKENEKESHFNERLTKDKTKKSQSYLEQEYKKFTEKLKKDPRMKGIVKESMEPIKISEAKKMIKKTLYLTFRTKDRNTPEFKTLEDTVNRLERREILSSLIYTKWENDFMGMLSDSGNPYRTLNLMSNRLSNFLFKRIKKNIFLKLANEYDNKIAFSYYEEVLEIVMHTCRRADLYCSSKVSFLFFLRQKFNLNFVVFLTYTVECEY